MKFVYFNNHFIHLDSLEEDASCDNKFLDINRYILSFIVLMQSFMSIDKHGFSSTQSKNFHLYSVRLWTLVELECIRNVGNLLLMNMSLLRGECVKKNLCGESCHMILMFSYTTATWVGSVQEHTKLFSSILELVSTFVCWWSICSERFDTYKE